MEKNNALDAKTLLIVKESLVHGRFARRASLFLPKAHDFLEAGFHLR